MDFPERDSRILAAPQIGASQFRDEPGDVRRQRRRALASRRGSDRGEDQQCGEDASRHVLPAARETRRSGATLLLLLQAAQNPA
jgi:hypothetical protein